MNASFQDRLRNAPGAMRRFVTDLVREMAAKVLFFFVAFMLIFLLFKLFVAQYSIEFSAFTTAAAAALVLGKLVSLLEWAQSRSTFATYRPIAVIAGKTLIYALVVILFRVGEQFLGFFRRERSMSAAFGSLIAGADAHRFLALLLLVTIVLGSYLTTQEIDRAIGRGKLFRILCEPRSKQDLQMPR